MFPFRKRTKGKKNSSPSVVQRTGPYRLHPSVKNSKQALSGVPVLRDCEHLSDIHCAHEAEDPAREGTEVATSYWWLRHGRKKNARLRCCLQLQDSIEPLLTSGSFPWFSVSSLSQRDLETGFCPLVSSVFDQEYRLPLRGTHQWSISVPSTAISCPYSAGHYVRARGMAKPAAFTECLSLTC